MWNEREFIEHRTVLARMRLSERAGENEWNTCFGSNSQDTFILLMLCVQKLLLLLLLFLLIAHCFPFPIHLSCALLYCVRTPFPCALPNWEMCVCVCGCCSLAGAHLYVSYGDVGGMTPSLSLPFHIDTDINRETNTPNNNKKLLCALWQAHNTHWVL